MFKLIDSSENQFHFDNTEASVILDNNYSTEKAAVVLSSLKEPSSSIREVFALTTFGIDVADIDFNEMLTGICEVREDDSLKLIMKENSSIVEMVQSLLGPKLKLSYENRLIKVYLSDSTYVQDPIVVMEPDDHNKILEVSFNQNYTAFKSTTIPYRYLTELANAGVKLNGIDSIKLVLSAVLYKDELVTVFEDTILLNVVDDLCMINFAIPKVGVTVEYRMHQYNEFYLFTSNGTQYTIPGEHGGKDTTELLTKGIGKLILTSVAEDVKPDPKLVELFKVLRNHDEEEEKTSNPFDLLASSLFSS